MCPRGLIFRRNTHILLHPHVAQVIRQMESPTYSSADQYVRRVPRNDPTLPQLTVAFKVFRDEGGCDTSYHLIPPSSGDELFRRYSKSVCILLESKHSITSDTLSVSLAFRHSNILHTISNQLDPEACCAHTLLDYFYPKHYVTTRTVRVVPMDGVRPRITICCLPMELLMKIFEATDSCACQWQHDLLSFAQVCRQWSQYPMRLFFTRLKPGEWENHSSCPCFSDSHSLDHFAFAKALRKTPFLGLGVQYLRLEQHNESWACQHWNLTSETSPGLSQALVTILHATKNLQRLRLSLGYSTQANGFFSTLPKLHDLHTLSITRRTTCQFTSTPPKEYWIYSVSATQLARCMARWPALTSLTVECLIAGNIGMGRFFRRSPACRLTQLCIRNSYMSNKDLLYLTASSAKTLVQVTLAHVWDITDAGLYVFLASISGNVTSLTIRGARRVKPPSPRKGPRALDAVVDKMVCLRALNIRGDVASERMLRRRSEMFLRNHGSGVPVVRLSFEAVPKISKCKNVEWAGWEVVEVR